MPLHELHVPARGASSAEVNCTCLRCELGGPPVPTSSNMTSAHVSVAGIDNDNTNLNVPCFAKREARATQAERKAAWLPRPSLSTLEAQGSLETPGSCNHANQLIRRGQRPRASWQPKCKMTPVLVHVCHPPPPAPALGFGLPPSSSPLFPLSSPPPPRQSRVRPSASVAAHSSTNKPVHQTVRDCRHQQE